MHDLAFVQMNHGAADLKCHLQFARPLEQRVLQRM
jgi:hypothetical protein